MIFHAWTSVKHWSSNNNIKLWWELNDWYYLVLFIWILTDKHWASKRSNCFSPQRPTILVTSLAEGELWVRCFCSHCSVSISNVTVTFLCIAALLHLKSVTSHSHICSGVRNLEYHPTRPQIGLQAKRILRKKVEKWTLRGVTPLFVRKPEQTQMQNLVTVCPCFLISWCNFYTSWNLPAQALPGPSGLKSAELLSELLSTARRWYTLLRHC